MESYDEPPAGFVRFDEREDVLASIDLLKLLAPLLEEHPSFWKWVIIAAANAVQGAMVCALVDSTGTSVLRKDSRKQVLAWLHDRSAQSADKTDVRLAGFDELLKACIRDLGLTLTDPQRRDVKRLHEHLRNNFLHFTPMGWGIREADLPRMIESALRAVEDLMSHDNVQRHLTGSDRIRLQRAVSATRASFGL